MTERISAAQGSRLPTLLLERAFDEFVAPLVTSVMAPVKRAIDANPELVFNLIVGLDAHQRFMATSDANQRIGAVRRGLAQDPLRYLREGVGGWGAVELFLAIREGGEESVLDALEPVLRSPALLAAVRAAIETAPVHDDTSRRQLRAGLEQVEAGDWALAWPLLISPVEGAFRTTARSHGIVDEGQRTELGDGRRRRAKVEDLFEPLGLEEPFLVFLQRRVYGSIANPHRHGTPRGGHRRQSLFLVVALIGWLDACAETELVGELFGGLRRELEHRQVAGLQRRFGGA